ncbi:MAG: tRNA pseudouridine(55) synthase TruB [Clostridia bacterium]|nr:tRNA pseudouridine(55) synthase TruB [Clostridia bacterium]
MNGLIIINKPKGYTSHDVINKIRKILNIKRVGHTGTLDPNATGVLPILIGNATKASKYLVEHKKTYVATLKLGEKTTTGDSEGQVIEKDSNFNNIEIKKIEDILKTFLGMQKQIPPIYSSIKVNGKKLYEYAREQKDVDIPSREIEIYNIDLRSFNGKDEVVFEVECSKGTYIRTLCEDIAKRLGTIGYMKELERTKVNEFNIEDSISIEKLTVEKIREKIITIEEIFKDKEKINLDNKKLQLFLNGVMLTKKMKDGIYRIYSNKNFIGLGIIKNNLLKRDIII